MNVRIINYINENHSETIDTTMEKIEDVRIGKNNTKKVLFNNGEVGFYKNSGLTTNEVLDELEYFISIIGPNILGVDVATTYKVFENENKAIGIISKSVINDEKEKLLMADSLIGNLLEMKNPELMLIKSRTQCFFEEKTKFFEGNVGEKKSFPVASTEDEIKLIIDAFPTAVDQLNISEIEKKEIKQNYFNMIIFDLLINQADRHFNNYGVIIDKKTCKIRFSTLFDNSTIYMPGVPENYYNLNGVLIDRSQMISCLLSNYGEYVDDTIGSLCEKKYEIIEKTSNVAKRELTGKTNSWFMPIFERNLENICSIYKKRMENNQK